MLTPPRATGNYRAIIPFRAGYFSAGVGATVIDALPDFPSLVAVMVAEPPATAVTRPLSFTVAFDTSDDDQVTTRPGIGSPVLESALAVSCCVLPGAMVAVCGVTSTVTTSTGKDKISEDPLLPSLVAVIVTSPKLTPVTRPMEFTVALLPSEVDHDIARPVRGAPFESSAVAVIWSVSPTTTRSCCGVTATAATGTGIAGAGLTGGSSPQLVSSDTTTTGMTQRRVRRLGNDDVIANMEYLNRMVYGRQFGAAAAQRQDRSITAQPISSSPGHRPGRNG